MSSDDFDINIPKEDIHEDFVQVDIPLIVPETNIYNQELPQATIKYTGGSGGGLMQLVAYGAQDIYLTGNVNSNITYFKTFNKKYTNFGIESNGPIGITGYQGPTGPIGPTGCAGLIGITGCQGIKGDTGAIGYVGPTGIQGIKGATGLTGLTGLSGQVDLILAFNEDNNAHNTNVPLPIKKKIFVDINSRGNGIYTSVKEAIDSITDNCYENQYEILVMSGQYTESVLNVPPYVHIKEMDASNTEYTGNIDNEDNEDSEKNNTNNEDNDNSLYNKFLKWFTK